MTFKAKRLKQLLSLAFCLAMCLLLVPMTASAAVNEIRHSVYEADDLVTGDPYIGSTLEVLLDFWIEKYSDGSDVWMERFFDWQDAKGYDECVWIYTPEGSSEKIVITGATFDQWGESELMLKPEWCGGTIRVRYKFPDGVVLYSSPIIVKKDPEEKNVNITGTFTVEPGKPLKSKLSVADERQEIAYVHWYADRNQNGIADPSERWVEGKDMQALAESGMTYLIDVGVAWKDKDSSVSWGKYVPFMINGVSYDVFCSEDADTVSNCCGLGIFTPASDIVASGDDGRIAWTLDENGILIISGNGMIDYSPS